ncbi:putative p-loop containing nucleoside triphosphate hydrolases superfamily protein [Melia azedarach]|uniref:P-loop containing nucleoside triphosphate hydrolases superfamily protein n=1 Tax=Melia azedarach TaxID=155640 RepID=A0ACC1YYK6_MELAZ|nr:putative p-loop containing nucleoside triphosphate hydrolases superfamily protein [Melia azedarach]
MGGGRLTPSEEEIGKISSSADEFSQSSSVQSTTLLGDANLKMKVDQGTVVNRENVFVSGELGSDKTSPASRDYEVDQRRKSAVFMQVLQSYDQLSTRIGSLREAKNRISSYTPGAWIENIGAMKLNAYDVPKTTSLILVGPKGSGKSSLINKISKVFEDDKFASERAQVTYNSSVGDGTYFLQEYMIPRGSNSFCLYDTRSLVDNASDNVKMIRQWITYGVRHGELVIRKSDSSSLRNRMKCKARKDDCEASERRMVNFVIFVLNGLEVLKFMEGDGDAEQQYTQMIRATFSSPYLSFKDDKPVVVVTHGDMLSINDRARIRIYLGELLGIPPAKQIFDIPESCEPENELVIVDMLRYCLEHADRNLPRKISAKTKIIGLASESSTHLLTIIMILILLTLLKILQNHTCHASKSDSGVDWHSVRHIW